MRSKTFEKVFGNLKNNGANACVIASSRGVPIAWFGLKKKSVELFSTLSAAIISASRILHQDADSSPPDNVVSESSDSYMIINSIGDDAIMVVFGEKKGSIMEAAKKAKKELRGVMK